MGMEKFFYRVKKGDTVLSISNTFKVSTASIIEQNDLNKEVSAGDLLLITKDTCVHVVEPFECEADICTKYGVSKEWLFSQNKVEYLFYGLVLKI